MKFPKKEIVERLRKEYPAGTHRNARYGYRGRRYWLPVGELEYGIRTECNLRRGSGEKDTGGKLSGRRYY